LATEPLVRRDVASDSNSFLPISSCEWSADIEGQLQAQTFTETHLVEPPDDAEVALSWVEHQMMQTHVAPYPGWRPVSPWSRSVVKRVFDCACVLLSLPLLIPIMLAISVAVRLTSNGPALFMQKRMGRHGRTFTIFKFRTLDHVVDGAHHPITTSGNQSFTPIGRFLRRWKLDELPQLLNVLAGQMSLVGPRPKLPEHVIFDLPCRPGITGMATIVFASEETYLGCLPKDQLDAFYHGVVLPAKRTLDGDYMAHATFLSDARLLVDSILRRWNTETLGSLIATSTVQRDLEITPARGSGSSRAGLRLPKSLSTIEPAEVEQVSAG
jgi:lipopolysaccharide/colanic/teichoic acid biosynthesis glycosyltransferase